MLSKQSTFRFYSSSLLIMYSASNGRKSSPASVGPAVPAASSDNLPAGPTPAVSTFVGRGSLHEPPSTFHPHVDVRMIDFAHATHHGFLQDKTAHVGPDHGYLFGLKNLIQLFENEVHSDETGRDSTAVTTDDSSAAVL